MLCPYNRREMTNKHGKVKQDYTAEVRRRLRESGAPRHLGITVESASKGKVVMRLDVRPHHRQIHGVVHGGIVATLADTAAGIAAATVVKPGTAVATVELKINYLEAIRGGRVRAEARVLRAGRHFIVVECDVWNKSRQLAAKALLTFGAAGGHTLEEK